VFLNSFSHTHKAENRIGILCKFKIGHQAHSRTAVRSTYPNSPTKADNYFPKMKWKKRKYRVGSALAMFQFYNLKRNENENIYPDSWFVAQCMELAQGGSVIGKGRA
jgi:hypothetical protein